MTIAGPAAHELRNALADQLAAGHHLPDARWDAAFRAVPREAFLTTFQVPHRDGGLDQYDLTGPERAAALAAVYTDNTLITQVDASGTATSSSTEPSLMYDMVHLLDVHHGHRVLEVGTGTGYHAALLSHVLGANAVTSVDIHADLVATARRRLAAAGYTPHVDVADGRDGYPSRAPYDRLIATCGFDRVPAAWLEQVRPGGRIVVNLSIALLTLTINPDETATGRFGQTAAFMAARDDAGDVAVTAADVIGIAAGSGDRPPRTAPWLAQLGTAALTFLRQLTLPTVRLVTVHTATGPEHVLSDSRTGSWVRARRTGHAAELVEHGPRRLYDELANLTTEWDQHGRPPAEHYGLTVHRDGTHLLWLDTPDRCVSTLTN